MFEKLNIPTVQTVLQALSDNGWNRAEKTQNIKDEEVKSLFNLIDKDKSGFLSMRVKHENRSKLFFKESMIISGGKEGL